MAARFWVGGTGTWDATTTANWSATSGGAGGASVPGAADDVTINTASITVTTDYNVSVISVTINASAATLSLGGTLTCSGAITLTQGTFTTNNYDVTAASLSSSNSNTRTINLGSSTVTLTTTATAVNTATNANLTFNAGTSTIICSGSNSLITGGASGGGSGLIFNNVSITATTAQSFNINSANTFNNLTVTAPASAGVTQIVIDSRQTINGTLSTTGTAGNRRVWFRGLTYGLAQTLTINSAPSLTDADFRDIYVIGTAAPISGTRIGDLRGIRGITASTPKTVYWNLAAGGNWSADAWAASSGGGVSTDNFPLAQDTAVIENTGLNTSATVTLDSAIINISTLDMSGRTNAMTLAGSTTLVFYGDWLFGSGVTRSYSGTLQFSGRKIQTITSAGKSFSNNFIVDTYGGSIELADALNIGNGTLTVTNGTFDTKGYNVTAGLLSSSNSNVRAITLGSSTVTLSGTGGVNFGTNTNLTFNAGTSQLTTTAVNPTIDGGTSTAGVSFYNVTMNGATAANTQVISGLNTFNNLTITAPAGTGLVTLTFDANQTITGTLTVAGASAVRRIFLRSDTLGTPRTLTVNSLSATDCDFRDITIAGTAAGGSPTRAGDCGGNSGVTFPAAKTVYWNLAGTQNWSATGWAPSSGGSPAVNEFPLAQDTAVFDEAGSAGTVSFDRIWNIGTFDASARTSAMTLSTSTNAPVVYGNWLFGTGITASSSGSITQFSGRGTQTITSNGIAFGSAITIACATGTVQLADALEINSARTLTLTSGTFDAVTYNVTVGLFTNNGLTTTLKMGSGTWTISGTGTAWNINSLPAAFYKGTADILLSNTSTTARTFAGGTLSYNKLTIGGATGTSTLTISSNNQFTELASTKTVAHTIALGTTVQTFGKWSVTGTAGNVVTLTGTGTTHVLAGACTDSIDYLAMGSIGFAATSPAEFYAGANSTGTAAAPVYRTAKPADSTRYWVGGTGNWNDTARWSTSSGGLGGADLPRSHDDVVFDSMSNATAYTATVNAITGGNRCKALTIAGPLVGNVTLAGSTALFIHDDITLPATGLTRTYIGAITLSGTGAGKTITTNGVTLSTGVLTLNGVGAEWSLGDALTMGQTSSTFNIFNGLFNTDNYSITIASIDSSVGNSRSITLGSSTVTMGTNPSVNFGTTESSAASLTFNAGTSQINVASVTPSFTGNNQTFYNVSFTRDSITQATLFGANTFNNLTVAGRTSAGVANLSLTADQTINGTLTLSAGTNATMRTFVRSGTIGTTRTLTCAVVDTLTDIDFRDITIAGAAAPVSGTRLGDCKGNSGITFDAAKTVYWRATISASWGTNSWSDTNGGAFSADNFPLAQDTAVFPSSPTPYPTSGNTVTINAGYNIGTIDMSARTTNTMTLSNANNLSVYGNWINGTGVTISGVATFTFAGRGSQTITSAGVTFTQAFDIDTPSGSVTIQDAFETNRSSTSAVTLRSGTFDANDYNVTLSDGGFDSNVTNTRTIAVGSGTWTIARSSTAWSVNTSNLTITGTGILSFTSASSKTFSTGSFVPGYAGITLNQGGAGQLNIGGNNSFADITNTYSATGATTISFGTTTQRVANFTATGTAGNVLTLQGSSASVPATLILTSGTVTTSDYLTITGIRAYDLSDTWYAGANSTNNGSLGWLFEAGVIPVLSNNKMFLLF